ncbi:MAG: glutamate synthase subunit beta [Clostridia bacterium]|nr:glutamate synthase subunit beta [Clostridia bacterium]
MGKPTGFLDYTRKDLPCEDVFERIRDYNEFHGMPDRKTREIQAARCMNCGVPFCQSEYGCPLHNLVPEWNDEVYAGNWYHAWARLMKTNNFPEFTGRVCPALCENACTCGIWDEPVTIRSNELAVIELAWEKGWMRPQLPAVRTGKKVAVIGSGPAGLAVADQLNQRGHSVTVYEKDDRPGGLLMYGIPNMKLDKGVVLRRIEKMKAEGIELILSAEIGKDIPASSLKSAYDAVVLSCGARKARVIGPELNAGSGVLTALDYLTESTRALLAGEKSRYDASGKNVVIVGNGDTATDCVATAVRQGAASVLQLVRKPRAAASGARWPYDRENSRTEYGQEEAAALYGQDPRLYETTLKELHQDEHGDLKGLTIVTAGKEKEIEAELLITAAGFSGTDPAIAEAFGLTLNSGGCLGRRQCAVDKAYRTDDPQIFTCGDMRRGPSLVVKAIADGRACARAVDEYLEGYSNM